MASSRSFSYAIEQAVIGAIRGAVGQQEPWADTGNRQPLRRSFFERCLIRGVLEYGRVGSS